MRLPSFRATGVESSPIKDSDQGNLLSLGATTIGAGATTFASDLDVTGYSTLWVYAEIGNATTPATAAADASPNVRSYRADGSGSQITIPADTTASGLSGSIAAQWRRYNVSGFTKLKVGLSNGNAGALQGGYLDYFLQR